MMIVELRRTTIACPSQWEGRLEDGRPLYVRFRHDELSAYLGPPGATIGHALPAPEWLWKGLHELKFDGLLEIDEMLAETGLVLSPELEGQRSRL